MDSHHYIPGYDLVMDHSVIASETQRSFTPSTAKISQGEQMENFQTGFLCDQCLGSEFVEWQLRRQSRQQGTEPIPKIPKLQNKVVSRSLIQTPHHQSVPSIREYLQGHHNENIDPTLIESQFQTPSYASYNYVRQKPKDPLLVNLESMKLPPSIPEYYHYKLEQDGQQSHNGSINQTQPETGSSTRSCSDRLYPRVINQNLCGQSGREYYAPTEPVPETYYRQASSAIAPVADNEYGGIPSVTVLVPQQE